MYVAATMYSKQLTVVVNFYDCHYKPVEAADIRTIAIIAPLESADSSEVPGCAVSVK